jgi:2-keto-myo-inositol isomerase
MILGFHGATSMTSSLETDVEATAQAGFKGLEVWAEKVDRYLESHTTAELQALFSERGISPLALDAIVFIGFRGSEYPLVQARCRTLSRIARLIGCPTIVVVPSPLPDREMTWADVADEYVKVLRDLADIAAGDGIRLSFEFLGFGWCSVRTPRAAWEIVRKVNRPNVGMTIDAAHFYGGGGLLHELDMLDPARIFAFHLDDLEDLPKEALTDASRLLPGEGIVPLKDICASLQRIGYNGHCSVELFRPEYWALPPALLAQKARKAALDILSPYFQVQ